MSNSRPRLLPEDHALKPLQTRYDQLWSEAIGRIQAGKIELDPILRAAVPDRRRGLTVIARPSLRVRQRIGIFLNELRALEPRQYYYTASELHVTVLSLFTATTRHRPFFARINDYISAVDLALRRVAPMRIEFDGVTVTAGTVMIQGFPENGALNELRDTVRAELRCHGLDESLDRRYRLESAHMTAVRFRTPLHESARFAVALQQARERSFGAVTVRKVSLVKNDWYMSDRVTETVKDYRLQPTP